MINEQSLDVFSDQEERFLEYDGETAYTSPAINIGYKESDKPAMWSKVSVEFNGTVTTDGTLVITIQDNTPDTSGSGDDTVETNYVYTFASAEKVLKITDGNPVLSIPLVNNISGKIKIGIDGTAVCKLYGAVKVYGG